MVFAVVFAAALALQPSATPSTEMLGINVPDQFQIGNHQRNDQAEIMELVVPPETVDNWSKLITSLMIFDGTKIGVETFYTQWRERMHSACPGLTDTLVRGTVDGHAAVRGTLSCPKNPQTGKPENVTTFLIQGDLNLMNAQVAFRHVVSPLDTALIARIAGSLKVCDQRTLQACKARKPSGFIPAK